MAAKGTSTIKMFDHEHRFLQEAYLTRGRTIEHYEVLTDELRELCDEWRGHCGRKDSDEEILRYMRTQRKGGRWVRFDGAHKKKPDLPGLSAEEKETLVEIYQQNVANLGLGEDNLAYEPEIATFIAREFESITGRCVPASQLVGILTKLRKRGLLPKAAQISRRHSTETDGFDDIDQVG